MARLCVVEVATLGLRDGRPTAISPFLYTGPVGACANRGVAPLAILVEPYFAWYGAVARAAKLVFTARRAMEIMSPTNVHAQLFALLEQLNAFEYAREREAGGHTGKESGFGITCVALAGEELFIAQAPPGQFTMRQGASVFTFPPDDGDADPAAGGAEFDHHPLGRRAQLAPRLMRTRVATDDVVMLASSTVTQKLPRLARELHPGSTDDLLMVIGASIDRACVRDGAVSIMRFG